MSIAVKSTRDGQSKVKKAAIAGVVMLVLLVLVLWALVPKSDGVQISESGFSTVKTTTVTDRVRVEGEIAPGTVETLYTSLSGKVTSLDVAKGDRVEAGQQLMTLDTEATQRELDAARVQQEGLVANSDSQVATARQQVEQYRAGIDNGTNPEISAANTALRQAQEQRTAAHNDLNAKAADPGLAAEVPAARDALNSAQSAVNDAEKALAAARTAAQNQLAAYERALTEAINSSNGARATSNQTLGQLQATVESGRVSSPFAGVVTDVNVEKGAIPSGTLLSIGDDTKLVVKTTVSEADVVKIEKGDAVTFTSGSSSKERTGNVASVSRIASSASTGTKVAATTDSNPKFEVVIEVTGDREGLLIGSKVRAQILTDEVKNTLAVPLDAVFTKDDGSKAVLILTEVDGGSVIEERAVETGVQNNVEVAVSGGELAEGDQVIAQPSDYRDQVGSIAVITADLG